MIALAPLYFLLPIDLPVIGVRRWVVLVVFLVSIGLFDTWRRHKGITFLGLRTHELKAVASYAWAAAGVTLVLWLTPRQDIAAAVLVGMAFVDPLAGELRGRNFRGRVSVGIPLLVYFALAFSVVTLWGDPEIVESLALALVGSAIAIPSEYVKIKLVDDDFLMLVLPAITMSLVAIGLWG